MTDKAEMPDEIWAFPNDEAHQDGEWDADQTGLTATRYIRADLHAAREAMIDMAGTAAALLESQAAEIAALKAHLKQGRELADELEGLTSETWIVNHELYDIVAHLRGDTP